MSKKPEMHPSGLTMARWQWPFKTPAERKLVAAWFAKQDKKTKPVRSTEPAPF